MVVMKGDTRSVEYSAYCSLKEAESHCRALITERYGGGAARIMVEVTAASNRSRESTPQTHSNCESLHDLVHFEKF